MTPPISVLLPYRDAAATIEEAADSVLAQRGVDLELIAIDDGSRDEGPRRVAGLAARHRGLVACRVEGQGIAAALRTGLALARAPLIARMDADDVSLPDRLKTQLEALRAAPRVAALGTFVEAFAPGGAVGGGLLRYVAWQSSIVSPAEHARQLFVESPLCHPSVLLRREALDAVGPWRDLDGPEDYDLWLRLDAAGWELAKVPEVLLRWRHRPGRATFADPRYALARLRGVKAPFLSRRLLAFGRPVVVWGAGATGKRLARELEPHGVAAERFVDIDPRKIGRRARGAPIEPVEVLEPGRATVVVAVGAPGARDLVRASLDARGFVEGADYLCAA